MKSRFRSIVLFSYVLLVSPAWAKRPSSFERAHRLVQKLHDDRLVSGTPAQNEQLAKEVDTFPHEIQNLIVRGILDYLDSAADIPATSLQEQIREALKSGSDHETSAFVAKMSKDTGSSYLVVFEIPYCAICSDSWMGVFSLKDGKYRVVAHVENPLVNQDIKTVPLWISDNRGRVLLYGTTWGDPHNRLNAVAFYFDGSRLQRFWEHKGLPNGSLDIKDNVLTLHFDTSLRQPSKQETEIYIVSTTGMKPQRVLNREPQKR